MKQVINKKAYDTERTAKVAEWVTTENLKDPTYIREELYHKRTGEYFLYGEGGVDTKYATPITPNHWTMGRKIIPLKFDEAKEWGRQHMTSDLYEQLFGDLCDSEDEDEKVICCFRLEKSSHRKLRRLSEITGASASGILDYLISKVKM